MVSLSSVDLELVKSRKILVRFIFVLDKCFLIYFYFLSMLTQTDYYHIIPLNHVTSCFLLIFTIGVICLSAAYLTYFYMFFPNLFCWRHI